MWAGVDGVDGAHGVVGYDGIDGVYGVVGDDGIDGVVGVLGDDGIDFLSFIFSIIWNLFFSTLLLIYISFNILE